jgi:hypothetical protein
MLTGAAENHKYTPKKEKKKKPNPFKRLRSCTWTIFNISSRRCRLLNHHSKPVNHHRLLQIPQAICSAFQRLQLYGWMQM